MGATPMPLGTLIAYVETTGLLGAIRFENGLFARNFSSAGASKILARIQSVQTQAGSACSDATAKMIYCTSWGKYQIMGFNLYNPDTINYGEPIAHYLFDDADQNATFQSMCRTVIRTIYTLASDMLDESARNAFAIKYNGSLSYAQRIAEALETLGVQAP